MLYSTNKPSVFISYRHADSASEVARIAEHLQNRFFPDIDIFRDIQSIAYGDDFDNAITRVMETVVVMLVVIGPDWLEARDERGNRRICQQSDTVRREIASAIRANVKIIPVILNNAKIPTATDLPEDIRMISTRKAVSINLESWYFGLTSLTKRVNELVAAQLGPIFKIGKYSGIALTLIMALLWCTAPLVLTETTLSSMTVPRMTVPSMTSFDQESSDSKAIDINGDREFGSFGQSISEPVRGSLSGSDLKGKGWSLLVFILCYGASSIFFLTRPFRFFFSIIALCIACAIWISTGEAVILSMKVSTQPALGLSLLVLLTALSFFESFDGANRVRQFFNPVKHKPRRIGRSKSTSSFAQSDSLLSYVPEEDRSVEGHSLLVDQRQEPASVPTITTSSTSAPHAGALPTSRVLSTSNNVVSEEYLEELSRKGPIAVLGIVSNGLIRPIDSNIKLQDGARVIIVASNPDRNGSKAEDSV